ncbi:hypothetical protein EPO05_04755 [Patescibacteria group bacterium]|nr:MAG: hypothetical protein EPO05_04755 [Patescibacteria group bacterium]
MEQSRCQQLGEKMQALGKLKRDFDAALQAGKLDEAKELEKGFAGIIKPLAERFSYLDFNQIKHWLKVNKLEAKLEGGSFEALMKSQVEFYRRVYGPGFKIDFSKIRIEKARLKRIQKGLETGCVSYPLLCVTPDKLSQEEQKMTEAQFAFWRILNQPVDHLYPLTQMRGIFENITQQQVLARCVSVDVNDFDEKPSREQGMGKHLKIIDRKKELAGGKYPTVSPGKVELIFTDRQSVFEKVPRRVVNAEGVLVQNTNDFGKIIKRKINGLTPAQWMVFYRQLDLEGRSIDLYERLMALVDVRGIGAESEFFGGYVGMSVSRIESMSGLIEFDLASNEVTDTSGKYDLVRLAL